MITWCFQHLTQESHQTASILYSEEKLPCRKAKRFGRGTTVVQVPTPPPHAYFYRLLALPLLSHTHLWFSSHRKHLLLVNIWHSPSVLSYSSSVWSGDIVWYIYTLLCQCKRLEMQAQGLCYQHAWSGCILMPYWKARAHQCPCSVSWFSWERNR